MNVAGNDGSGVVDNKNGRDAHDAVEVGGFLGGAYINISKQIWLPGFSCIP